jgi:hypothetical protein
MRSSTATASACPLVSPVAWEGKGQKRGPLGLGLEESASEEQSAPVKKKVKKQEKTPPLSLRFRCRAKLAELLVNSDDDDDLAEEKVRPECSGQERGGSRAGTESDKDCKVSKPSTGALQADSLAEVIEEEINRLHHFSRDRAQYTSKLRQLTFGKPRSLRSRLQLAFKSLRPVWNTVSSRSRGQTNTPSHCLSPTDLNHNPQIKMKVLSGDLQADTLVRSVGLWVCGCHRLRSRVPTCH